MVERTLKNKLLQLASVLPVIAVMGPRQSGKTTLVKYAFDTAKYVSFENFDTRSAAEEDPKGFLKNFKSTVILDEVQKVPSILSYLQTIVDERNQPGQFILTGSQNFLLHEKISQTLAGRIALLKLLPFDFDELQNSPYNFSEPEDYIFHGFYPRIYASGIAPNDWYPSYIQTYIERDVRQIKNIEDLSVFQKFLKLCAGRIGQLLNLSSLASDCGITHNTAKSWISILEASFIVFLLQPHYKNFNKRMVKMPKLYFYDTGVASSLLGISQKEQLATHFMRGNLFENFVIAEFIKYRWHNGIEPNCFFWRDKAGHEIDCIIETAGKFTPVEIKSSVTAPKEYFDNIKYWNNFSGVTPENSFVVYGGDDDLKQKYGNLISWKNMLSVLKNGYQVT